MNGHRRGLAVLGALVLAGTATAVAIAGTALQTPQQVTHQRGRQTIPAAAPGGAYIAYAQSRRGNRNHFDVYLQQAGHTRIKVNGRGQGWPGGFFGNTFIYQQLNRGQSDIHVFDLTTHHRSVPPGVNTRRWEWQPSISGQWILYGQEWGARPINDRVILWNAAEQDRRVLDQQIGRPDETLWPGQVSGDFATWTRWARRGTRLNVFRYQISTHTTVKVPRPPRHAQYAASVSSDGTIFYVRSGLACGAHAVLHEYDPGTQTDTALARVPLGYDVNVTYTVDEDPGHTVYFDRFRCRTGSSHIFKITAP
jgi:Tol biopolymer transport system component